MSTMPPAGGGTGGEINQISKVAKDYYDSDNAFNFYRQVADLFKVSVFERICRIVCFGWLVNAMCKYGSSDADSNVWDQ